MKTIIAALMMFVVLSASAQTYTTTGIKSVRIRSTGEVIHNNQVKGYYTFYNLERKTSKTNNYLLTVLDENLSVINKVEIVRSANFTVLEAAFNGKQYAVIGYDDALNVVEIIAYDSTLRQTATSSRIIKGNNLKMAYGAAANGNETEQRFLVPVTNEGFLLYSVGESKKPHYRVEFLNANLKTVWTDEAAADAGVEMAFEAFQDSKAVGTLIERREKTRSKDIEYDLLVNNSATGKRMFKIPVVANKFTVAVSDVRHDTVTNEFVVFGEFYSDDARETRDRSLGFMNIVYDSVGKIKSQKTTTWSAMSQVTPLNERGQFEGSNTTILFHNTIRTNDGRIFIIGEQYKKTANGAGIALNAASLLLGGGSSTSVTQLNIYNIVIFQFSPDFTVEKVHVFEKEKSVLALPQGALYLSPKVVSNYGKAVGAFDYAFTQTSEDNSTFIVNYVDYDRKNESGQAFIIGSIVYTPEKTFTVDKFKILRKTSQFQVLKAKPGYLLVTEYFRKEKKLESRLEKVNY